MTAFQPGSPAYEALIAERNELRSEIEVYKALVNEDLRADNARLRAALQEIRELENNKIVSGEGLFMRALLIAGRALEPKS